MPSKLLKVLMPYAVSTAKQAYLVHKVDESRSRVRWYRGHPERTTYMIRYICNSTERAGRTKFFKKPPRGYKECKACQDPLSAEEWRRLGAGRRRRR